MAVYHERKAGCHRCAGYAAAGYPAGPGSDRNADRGYRAAAAELCGADGAGVYPSAAGGGDRGSEGEGRAHRAKTVAHP